MVKEIRIYYEGSRFLRPGFSAFFSELIKSARTRRCAISFVSADGGPEACRDFGIALKSHAEAWNILLRDSEGPHTGNFSAQLCQEQGWDKSHADSI